MKTRISTLLLFLCFNGMRAQTFEIEGAKFMDTINKIDMQGYKVGKWVLRGKHFPKSGYKMEGLIETGMYINNRKDGVWIEYYKNGKMRSKLTYVNGVLNGAAAFYDETEKVLKEGAFKDNKWVQ